MMAAESSSEKYLREQSRLAAKSEGEPDPTEIDIPQPKEPEINPEVYKDVVPYLSRGFLTVTAEINDVFFVFKSLNHHEFEMVGLMGGYQQGGAPPQKFWDLFLAYGVFMVNGENILVNRDRAVREIASAFGDFTPGARSKLVRHLSELNRRASVAAILTESYATESYSRYRWAQIRGLDLMAPTVTGINGTEKLGLNYGQLTWRALNYYEDTHEQMEREWENAKFVGACMAGKGISKVNAADEKRRRTQKEMLIARKDALIRHALFGEPLDTGMKKKDDRVVIAATTAAELGAQLQASLRGEKDWHDRVVESYEQQIRDRYSEQEKKLHEILETHREEFQGRSVVGGTQLGEDLQGLTPEQVHERMVRRKQLEAQAVAQRLLSPHMDEQDEIRHRKWGLTDSSVNSSFSETDRDPSQAVPILRAPATGKPFGRR